MSEPSLTLPSVSPARTLAAIMRHLSSKDSRSDFLYFKTKIVCDEEHAAMVDKWGPARGPFATPEEAEIFADEGLCFLRDICNALGNNSYQRLLLEVINNPKLKF